MDMHTTPTPHALHAAPTHEFRHALNPFAMLRNLWHYRDLIRQFTIREVLGRYRGSFLGFFWTFVSPLLMLGVYASVFGILMKHKNPDGTDKDMLQFTIELFCGMILFTVFSETLGRAPTLITGNINYVKKVVFPLEVLPAAAFGCSLIHSLISTLVLLAGIGLHSLFYVNHFSWTMLLYPVAILPLLMLCSGLAWIVASLGVFVRDLAQIVTFVIQLLMFTTPIFYQIDDFPKDYRWIFNLNPLALIITDARRTLIWCQQPAWWPGWVAVTALCFAVMLLGYAWFMHSKKYLADII